jgi:hypothetical protein
MRARGLVLACSVVVVVLWCLSMGSVALAAPEAPVTEPAGSVGANSAVLSGELNPGSLASDGWYFAYNTNGGCLGGGTAGGGGLTEVEKEKVSAEATGLEPGTNYLYCLVEFNEAGEETAGSAQSFTTSVSQPVVDSEGASGVGSSSATLEAQVNPEKQETSCLRFEYGETKAYGSTTPCNPSSLGEGFGDQTASAGVTGLKVGTTYHFRVVVENKNSPGGGTYGPDRIFATLPLISKVSFSNVGPHGAKLSAQLNTYGFPIAYHFEYGATSAYGLSTPVASGSGEGGVSVSAILTGLEPNTEYHFRAVASNTDGANEEAHEVFRTQPVGINGLPDGRVYEKVSSLEAQERDVFVPFVSFGLSGSGFDGLETERPFQVSNQGDAVAYLGEPSEPDGNGNGGLREGIQYLARRSSQGGWSQADLQPSGYNGSIYQGFSSELTTGYLSASSEGEEGGRDYAPPLANGAPVGVDMLYARPLGEERYEPFFTSTPPNRIEELEAVGVEGHGVRYPEMAYAGSSADGSRHLFEANDALVGGAEAGDGSVNNLFESVGGQLRLVNVLPDGSTKANATFGGLPGRRHAEPDFDNVISEDGTRIFWTDLNTGDIYVREDGSSTVSVSAGPAQYWTASRDGRYAYYTEAGGLWRFATQTDTRESLIPDMAEVQGVIAASDDGEYIYFVADQALGSHGVNDESNLYLLHGGRISFIATLSPGDLESVQPFGAGAGNLAHGIGLRTAQSTPDGRELVFMSSASLTGYNNVAPVINEEQRAVSEVYVYDAENAQLVCASCDRSGESPPPSGEGGWLTRGEAAAFLPISWSATYQPRWIADDGSRVFFDADVPLVSRDTNNTQDVYEWEREGTGGCREAPGCIYLLSDGISRTASWLVGTDAGGRDVFFVSRAELTSEDSGGVDVLYDAREGGVRLPLPPQCSGTGCQGVPGAPPVFATPASVTFEGVGNFTSSGETVVKSRAPKLLSAQQKLARALRSCVLKRSKKSRKSCVLRARRRFGVKSNRNAKKSTRGRR